jgi:Protein of unknown function (DUF1549)/Protein of unknown function (DUF1553)/Planctomycete cytochrome C
LVPALAAIVAIPAIGADESLLDFNRDIRPILSENCFYCHGQDASKRAAELRLDDPTTAVETGAIVPRDVNASELVARIRSTDPDTLMPPPHANRMLSEEQKGVLERWIAQGAQYSAHWAFVTPTRPELPAVSKESWVRNSIDRFVLAKLESLGIAPSPEADRATLAKRLYVDLTGLPPTPAEVDVFVRNDDPNAYEQLVDHLLNSRHYGERMGLPWLDAARYSDSNGFQQDGDTWQWIWRDWVVKAFNEDLPFDQFTIWQLAGDLLPGATDEQKIASGFNRNHMQNGEGGAIPEEQRFVTLFDRIDTTATTWLALTMACAQCHDHKYDPITQRDYYSLMDAFNRVPESGVPAYLSARIRLGNPYLELPTEENKAKLAEFDEKINVAETNTKAVVDALFDGWRTGILADGKSEGEGLPDAVGKLLGKPEAERNEEEKKQLADGLRKHFDEKIKSTFHAKYPELAALEQLYKDRNQYRNDQIPRPMVMSDDSPRKTHVLERGEYLKPTEEVSFATPGFLPPLPADAPKNRLGFAQWLVSDVHPLTSRVQVNKMWQHFFAAGIVKTAEDFGVQSEYPIHGALLDWLAVEFRASGWRMKALNRLIVTSSTYRQSSRVTDELKAIDIENRLYARASRFRMPSLILRDWALASAGLLDQRVGGVPVYPYQPDQVWEPLAITKERDFTYPQSTGPDLYRRSLYTFWRRTVSPANMFDTANRQACRVRQSLTSTPLHSLTMMNDPTWVEAARVLAEKSLKSHQQTADQLRHAFTTVVCRTPAERDLLALQNALDTQVHHYTSNPEQAKLLLDVGTAPRDESIDAVQHAALSIVCLAILNLDEAMTRE